MGLTQWLDEVLSGGPPPGYTSPPDVNVDPGDPLIGPAVGHNVPETNPGGPDDPTQVGALRAFGGAFVATVAAGGALLIYRAVR